MAGTGWDLPHNGWANSIYVKAKHLLLREPGPGIHGCRTAQEGSWAFQHKVLLEWNGAISQKRSPWYPVYGSCWRRGALLPLWGRIHRTHEGPELCDH